MVATTVIQKLVQPTTKNSKIYNSGEKSKHPSNYATNYSKKKRLVANDWK